MIAFMTRSIIVAALVALAALALERALPAGRRSRWIWAGALLAAAALPWLGRFLPGFLDVVSWPALAGGGDGALAGLALPNRGAASDVTPSVSGVDAWLVAAWLVVSVAFAAILAASGLRLRGIMRAGTAARVAGVPVRLTRDLGPAAVGVLRPQIAVPRWLLGLSSAEMRLALDHEREHLRAGDTRLLAGAAALCAAMPWNLPLWWIAGRLGSAVEADCDARVLAYHDPVDYGRLLLRVARCGGASRPAVPALVGAHGNLERRIETMMSPAKRFRSLLGIPLLAAATAALFLACDAADEVTAPEPAAETEGGSFTFAETGEKAEAGFQIGPRLKVQLRPTLHLGMTGADGQRYEIPGNHFEAIAPVRTLRAEKELAVEARYRTLAPARKGAPHDADTEVHTATFELREVGPRR